MGEEDEDQRVHPRRIQVKCKTWVINMEEGGGGRDVNKIMEVYLDFDMLHFCVTFKFSCDEA